MRGGRGEGEKWRRKGDEDVVRRPVFVSLVELSITLFRGNRFNIWFPVASRRRGCGWRLLLQ